MGTVRLEGTWVIPVPRQAAYAVMTDFERFPVYFPAVAKSVRVVSLDEHRFVVDAETKAFLCSKTYQVRMEGELQPPEGFESTNTSSIGVEHETFMMEEVPEGTRVRYLNLVEVKSRVLRLLAPLLLKQLAVWYWKRSVIDRIEDIVATHRLEQAECVEE
jgi:carbon monoxide dehydrogenase subunit G